MCRGTRSSISMDNCTRQYKLSEEYCRAWQDEDPSMTRFNNKTYNDCFLLLWLTIGKHYSLVNILELCTKIISFKPIKSLTIFVFATWNAVT